MKQPTDRELLAASVRYTRTTAIVLAIVVVAVTVLVFRAAMAHQAQQADGEINALQTPPTAQQFEANPSDPCHSPSSPCHVGP